MLVKGTHFTATLPPDWQEDPEGTPSGGLRFVDAAYREIIFSALRFQPTGEQTLEWFLVDLAHRKAEVARQNGATWVSEPRVEPTVDPCVTQLGSASQDHVAVSLFEASVTHREPFDGGHFVVNYLCYDYWPPQRSMHEGPPNAYKAEAFAREVLATIRLLPTGTGIA